MSTVSPLFTVRRGLARVLGAASLAALLFTAGCAGQGADERVLGPESVLPDAMKRPADLSTVCILRNPVVESARLTEAMAAGAEKFGSKVKILAPTAGPQACSFVVAYTVEARGNAVHTIVFQTFENSIPRMEARGTAGEGAAALTFDTVAEYMTEILRRTAKRIEKDFPDAVPAR